MKRPAIATTIPAIPTRTVIAPFVPVADGEAEPEVEVFDAEEPGSLNCLAMFWNALKLRAESSTALTALREVN